MLEVGPALVGQSVCNAARLDWGVGKVLRVQQVGESWRVSIQFHGGHRVVSVPPAKLVAPGDVSELNRAAGWLETAAGSGLDSKLRELPEEVRFFLGTALQKFAALLPLYDVSVDTDPSLLERWARTQTGIGQPLAQWSRDELEHAYAIFCQNRDVSLRETVDRVIKAGELEEAIACLRRQSPRSIARVADASPKIKRAL